MITTDANCLIYAAEVYMNLGTRHRVPVKGKASEIIRSRTRTGYYVTDVVVGECISLAEARPDYNHIVWILQRTPVVPSPPSAKSRSLALLRALGRSRRHRTDMWVYAAACATGAHVLYSADKGLSGQQNRRTIPAMYIALFGHPAAGIAPVEEFIMPTNPSVAPDEMRKINRRIAAMRAANTRKLKKLGIDTPEKRFDYYKKLCHQLMPWLKTGEPPPKSWRGKVMSPPA